MQRSLTDRTMPLLAPALAILCAVAVVGCVSTGTHTKTLTELEAEKKTSGQLQMQLNQEATQRKAAERQAADLQARLDGLEREKRQLNSDLGTVRGQITDLEQKYASGNASSQEEIAKLRNQASEL